MRAGVDCQTESFYGARSILERFLWALVSAPGSLLSGGKAIGYPRPGGITRLQVLSGSNAPRSALRIASDFTLPARNGN